MSKEHESTTETLAEQEESTHEVDDGEFIVQDYPNSVVQGESVTVTVPDEDDDTAAEDKNYVQLDMVNYTLVRCQENENSAPEYRLVTAQAAREFQEGQQNIGRVDGILPDGTMYVLDDSGVGESATDEGGARYVTVVNRGAADPQGTLMIMEYAAEDAEQPLQQHNEQPAQEETEEGDTSATLLAQVTMDQPVEGPIIKPPRPLGRKRGALPPAHELLSSPTFKLYLYSCKHCAFKCNSMREMTYHKKDCRQLREGVSPRAYKSPPRAAPNPNQPSQCPKCGIKYYSVALLKNHMDKCKGKNKHVKRKNSERDEREIEVLQCAYCGYETTDKPLFHRHLIKHRQLSGRIVPSPLKPDQ